MKRTTNILVVILLATTLGCSQNSNKRNSEMTFKDGLEFDFGKIEYASDGSHEFVFKNTGKEPLIITNVHSSCGCTVPTYPKKPVGKNEKASILVKYDTKRKGSFSKTITVYSNAKNSPITLKIKGEVLAQEKNQ